MQATRRIMMERTRIEDPWGRRTPFASGHMWPERVDEHYAEGVRPEDVQEWVQAASILDSNGDAMDIGVIDGRIVGVRGRASDRVNRGRLDIKSLHGWESGGSRDRLTTPMVREGGQLVPTDWDTAMGRVVQRCRDDLESKGPRAISFYTSGQLFAEEYFTLTTIARAGIGTNHLDGNTRLCTATAGEALKETFGSDGQPATYADVDHADVIALFGHNVAETQPVLWMRILDRLAGEDPPRLLVVDPRRTVVAEHATIHLAPRPGTNLAVLNALLHEVIERDRVDHAFVEEHTVGYGSLADEVADCTPEWAAQVCGLESADISAAAELVGGAERLLATVLQGVYQSHQATATAVQVNNLVLLRGMLGRPGCGVLQMNGQPTAENTRECGADGDLPGFRNWQNDEHIQQLAEIWNVDIMQVPHHSPPTHVMEMLHHMEEGTITFLWISATNPAVSLPELARIRSILSDERLFVVVQDIFPTETTALADVVLPAAGWGEKTGIFTNTDRTVHLTERAVDPPGDARPDLDIFLDFAARMELTDRDGEPLVSWHDPESAFEAWKRCSAGRPCDYSGMSYDLLRERGGIQWPCTEERPEGTERLYGNGGFWAAPSLCETYGRDLTTGASVQPTEYKALNPTGKAVLKGAAYLPPHEEPDEEYPMYLTTGRTIYHFHTRTKTGRSPELNDAAPRVWVELSEADATDIGVGVGDRVQVSTPRGAMRGEVRIGDCRPGVAFVPFHYGYWDTDHPEGPPSTADGRAANETTVTDWDPVSKQPMFKLGVARIEKVTS